MDTDSLPAAETKPSKLRWYQWRLRSLFVLTLLVAIGMSWLTVTIQSQRRQFQAAEAIKKAGGRPEIELTWLGKLLRDDSLVRVTRVDLCGDASTDARLERLLECLNHLPQLHTLSLWNSRVTDAGLERLEGLRQLRNLHLGDTEITDAGLVHLKGMTQLRTLDLSGTQVTDAGLQRLKGLTHLRTLHLSGTQVTDAGLEHLKGLTQLQTLCLAITKVSDVGVECLQRALPNCQAERRVEGEP
jgi:hypothetical protein